jgi:hypothetical protein
MSDTPTPTTAPPSGNQSVQLGIGTLIIIALIVTMCSGSGEVQNLRSENAELKQQVGEINRKLDLLLEKQGVAPAGTGEQGLQ